ncbi:MAG TPA: VapC toxin family PIN domain ribonuclease [Chloroflexota bacterium]|nr:VapC toxin family PIN domain ribonuclease [Chloroflexota bacterium]
MKFADTGWWAAWTWPGDARHPDATRLLSSLQPREQLLTTNFVAGETWTLLRARDRHETAVMFRNRIEALASADRLILHRVSADQEAAAWEWLRRHDERVYSFVDATSFQVMRDRRLREALAFDSDFAAAGFVEVRA